MKKLTLLGLIVLGSSLMSFTTDSEDTSAALPAPPIITHTCPNGYTFDYFDDPALTPADHADIQSSACNDPNNEPTPTIGTNG